MHSVISAVLLVTLSTRVNSQEGTCKNPPLTPRLLQNDVRAASPFYVLGLPRSPKTEQIDNICYSYYENGNNQFFNILSVTYKNGSNELHAYVKGDVKGITGLGQAISQSADSPCVFHDYTLSPICNTTVFPLYRCYVQGPCGKIDIGPLPGVDVKLILAATQKISPECRRETELTLQDTSLLVGDDYILLPNQLRPRCVTQYNNRDSIGNDRALGTLSVSENEVNDQFTGFDTDRFGSDATVEPIPVKPVTFHPQRTLFNPYGYTVKTNKPAVHLPTTTGYKTAVPGWSQLAGPPAEQHLAWHTAKNEQTHPHVYYYYHPWQLRRALL